MIKRSLCPANQLHYAVRYETIRQQYFANLGDQAKADDAFRRADWYWNRCQEEAQ